MPIALPAAIAIGGGTAVAGVAGAIGSSKAAKTAANSAQQSNQLQQAMYNQTRSDLMPFQQVGQQGIADFNAQKDWLNTPFSMTQENLEKTPGYQFTRTQGLKAVNNNMGARGLFNSGAAMKGAANYATGLADSTYMDQFNMDQTQKQNIYNRLMGPMQLGEAAGAQTGAYGMQNAANQSQTNMTAAQLVGNAQMSGANAIGGIGSSLANLYSASALMKQMGGLGTGMGGNALLSSMYGSPGTAYPTSLPGIPR